MDELTIDEAQEGFINNTFTCRELVDYYIQRIRQFNGPLPDERDGSANESSADGAEQDSESPNLNAIITISTTALEEATELDDFYATRNALKGPLHGIPVIVKDSIATAGLRTTYGSIKAKDYVPTEDAGVITKLKEAGAIILAKSTLPDWSASFHCTSSLSGTTRNPHDTRRDPCSGTAAAIAADFAILGLDTDTDGNIRLSASFCSLVGLRPRPGMISRYGISPLVVPQDTPGPICRNVRDLALMYDAMVGFDSRDNLTVYSEVMSDSNDHEQQDQGYAAALDLADANTLRIGVVDSLFGPEEDEDCRPVNDLVRDALDRLQEAGATVLPVAIAHLRQWFTTTQLYADRSKSDLDNFFIKHAAPLNLSVNSIMEEKAYHPAQDLFELIAKGPESRFDPAYAMRLEKHVEFRPFVMSQMRQYGVDFLAFPTCQIPAPRTSDVLSGRWKSDTLPTNTYLAAQTVLPAVSVPVGETREGLPVGMTLMTSIYHEKQLLEAATVLEREVRGRVRPRLRAPQ